MRRRDFGRRLQAGVQWFRVQEGVLWGSPLDMAADRLSYVTGWIMNAPAQGEPWFAATSLNVSHVVTVRLSEMAVDRS